MSVLSCFPVQWLASFFFAVWRIAMGMRSPVLTALLEVQSSGAAPLPLVWEQEQRWGLAGKDMEDSALCSPHVHKAVFMKSEKGTLSALLRYWREGGNGPQSHFQNGHVILARFQPWLERDALAAGRENGLWLVMHHGGQKGRCMPESMRYHLSFPQTVIFKCLLVDDLLPTAGSVSLVLRLRRSFWVWFTLKFETKMKCWKVIAIPTQHSVLCI